MLNSLPMSSSSLSSFSSFTIDGVTMETAPVAVDTAGGASTPGEARLPLTTALATATAAVAVITLGMEGTESGTVDVAFETLGFLVLGGLLLGNGKCVIAVSLESRSKFNSFLAVFSSVLDPEDMPESGEVGLSRGDVLSGKMYLGARPREGKQNVHP